MAAVKLAFSAPPTPFSQWKHGAYFLLKHSAEIDSFGVHHLTEDPEKADLILFVEMGESGSFAERVRANALFRRYRDKCFLFDQGDLSYPILPGIYAGLTELQFRKDHTRTGFYLLLGENILIQHVPATGEERYLASFIGSFNTAAVRSHFANFDGTDFQIRDTSSYSAQMRYHGQPSERLRFWTEYADSIAQAKFSLCPRGASPHSIRLFESMKTGRACIILSDEWHPNDGVDWDSFAIRVPESQVSEIPRILMENEHRAASMGANARREWEKWFSPEVQFHHVVEQCLEIQRLRGPYSRIKSLWHYRYIAKHPRRYLSSKRNLYRNNNRIYW
ncbi:MAG: exostosin domain-containing protein [Acidobacteriaceae bacterium]